MTRRLRVLHCVPSLNASDGGPARSVPALAGSEARAGVDVRVWSRQPPTIDLVPFQPASFVAGDLDSVVTQDWIPDLIHDHGLWLRSNHASARLGRHNRIPRIVSPRGMLEPWCLQHRRYKKLLAWQFYQHRDLLSSACLHATSQSEARQFRQLGFGQPIVLLPNGVTLPTTPSNADSNRHYENAEDREILFLSRIHPVKGLPHLIEAWSQVVRPGWRLKIVGADEDGHKNEIQNLVTERQLSDSVTICDAVHSDEKWSLLRNADALVLPSFSENFGIVVAEALAVGTPVITTTGTPWQRVVSERCGWYAEPTVAGMTQALNSALQTSRAEIEAMGRRGEKWVRQEFAWDDVGEKMLAAYDSILGTGTHCEWIDRDPTAKRAA